MTATQALAVIDGVRAVLGPAYSVDASDEAEGWEVTRSDRADAVVYLDQEGEETDNTHQPWGLELSEEQPNTEWATAYKVVVTFVPYRADGLPRLLAQHAAAMLNF